MAGFRSLIRHPGSRRIPDDQIIQVIREGEVKIIGERIRRLRKMPPYVRASEPSIGLSRANELRAAGRVEGSVVVVHQRVKPRVRFQTPVAVVDFPGVLPSSLADGDPRAVTDIVGGCARVFHVFTPDFQRELTGIAWETVELVSGG